MKFRRMSLVALAIALSSMAFSQGASPAPGQGSGQRGQGGGRGWGPGLDSGSGSGLFGTVTEADPDHFTVKEDTGETWTVHFSANTRMMKQPPRPVRTDGQDRGPMGTGGPEQIKAADIKVGDVIMAGGETDQSAKSVGAVMVMLLDAESAKRLREMQANFGKTWLAGRVTAIDEMKITLHSGLDNSDRTFVVDENTSFRRRREPVTLADVQVGDNVRVEGAVNGGQFVATAVNVMMPPTSGGPAQRQGPPPQ
jgi:hypothetical protein